MLYFSFLFKYWEFCAKAGILHTYCRALVPNVIIDGKDDDDDDEEEEDEKKTGAAGEQFASDAVHVHILKNRDILCKIRCFSYFHICINYRRCNW